MRYSASSIRPDIPLEGRILRSWTHPDEPLWLVSVWCCREWQVVPGLGVGRCGICGEVPRGR